MRHVDDAHHAEDDRQPDGDHRVEGTRQQSVDDALDQGFHADGPQGRSNCRAVVTVLLGIFGRASVLVAAAVSPRCPRSVRFYVGSPSARATERESTDRCDGYGLLEGSGKTRSTSALAFG